VKEYLKLHPTENVNLPSEVVVNLARKEIKWYKSTISNSGAAEYRCSSHAPFVAGIGGKLDAECLSQPSTLYKIGDSTDYQSRRTPFVDADAAKKRREMINKMRRAGRSNPKLDKEYAALGQFTKKSKTHAPAMIQVLPPELLAKIAHYALQVDTTLSYPHSLWRRKYVDMTALVLVQIGIFRQVPKIVEIVLNLLVSFKLSCFVDNDWKTFITKDCPRKNADLIRLVSRRPLVSVGRYLSIVHEPLALRPKNCLSFIRYAASGFDANMHLGLFRDPFVDDLAIGSSDDVLCDLFTAVFGRSAFQKNTHSHWETARILDQMYTLIKRHNRAHKLPAAAAAAAEINA
jgi:hypothetical protein